MQYGHVSLVMGSPEQDTASGGMSPVLKEGSHHSTHRQHSTQCSPRGCLLLLQQGHTAGAWPTCPPPGLPGLFLQTCFPDGWPQPVLLQEIIPLQLQDFTGAIVEVYRLPHCPFPQPVKVILNSSTTTGESFFLVLYHFSLFESTFCPIGPPYTTGAHQFLSSVDKSWYSS